MEYNDRHIEGGIMGTHPAWPSGQDGFEESAAEPKGVKNATYHKALGYIQTKSREYRLDAALRHGGQQLDGLLVPSYADGGVAAASAAAKAGKLLQASTARTA